MGADEARRPAASPADDAAWLTILMPTLNGAAFIAETLRSVEAQGDDGLRLVVVDGGSTDDTVEIIRGFQPRLAIDLIERPDSEGWVWSTNLALSRAQTTYACLLHQDDTWLVGRAAAARVSIANMPQAALHLSDADFIDADGARVGRWSCPLPRHRGGLTSQEALRRLLIQDFIACPAPVFRTDAACAVGGLDPDLWYTADWDFWLKLAAQGAVAHDPAPRVGFRIHPQSLTVRGSAERPDLIGQMTTVLDRHAGALVDPVARGRAARAARFSNLVNASLATALHTKRLPLGRIAWQAARLGPSGIARYLRCSRISQRVGARLRAGLGSSRVGPQRHA